MSLLSPLRVLIIKGRCPIHPSISQTLSKCIVRVAEPGEVLPAGSYDMEVVETHLTGEEWKELSLFDRAEQPGQRIHVCLAQPLSAIICRNAIREYERAVKP